MHRFANLITFPQICCPSGKINQIIDWKQWRKLNFKKIECNELLYIFSNSAYPYFAECCTFYKLFNQIFLFWGRSLLIVIYFLLSSLSILINFPKSTLGSQSYWIDFNQDIIFLSLYSIVYRCTSTSRYKARISLHYFNILYTVMHYCSLSTPDCGQGGRKLS